jgi:hypothetical protein
VQFVDDGDEVAPSFSVTVNDGDVDSNTLAATISYTPVNDTPVVTSASLTASEGQTVTLSGANFAITDADDTSFTYTVSSVTGGIFQLSSAAGTPITSFTSADLAGSLVQFVDDGNEVAPSFSVTVNDGDADSNTLAATIAYTPVNDTPATSPVTLAPIAEDSGARLITQAELLTHAADVEGDALTATTLAISAGNGSLVDHGDGTWSHTPAADDDTSVSFSYTITDGTDTVAGSATLDITPDNDAPVAANDTINATEDTLYNGTLPLATDADGDTVTYALDTDATNGTVVVNGDGSFHYTSNLNTNGADSFTYTLSDGNGGSNAYAVSVNVAAVNDSPAESANRPPYPGDSGGIVPDPEPIAGRRASDTGGDSNAGGPTDYVVVEESLGEEEPVPPVEEYLIPKDSADTDETLVLIKEEGIEETEILYLTDENDTDTQPEGREDDRSYIYFDNDLYKEITSTNYFDSNYKNSENYKNPENALELNKLTDFSAIDFENNDLEQVVAHGDYDLLREEIDEAFNSERQSKMMQARIATVTTATFTVGIVSYLLRAGSLVTSMMSMLPLWRGFDPIVVLSRGKKTKAQNDTSDTGPAKPDNFFDREAE